MSIDYVLSREFTSDVQRALRPRAGLFTIGPARVSFDGGKTFHPVTGFTVDPPLPPE